MNHPHALLRARWWLISAILVAAAVVAGAWTFFASIPLPEATPGAQSTKLLDVHGQIIGVLHGDENRTIVALSKISVNLQHAVIATEDRGFYNHPGVSLRGILRAAFSNVRDRGVEQGGSTLTQQYVRNAFTQVGRERTFLRKIREATVALKIERRYSKEKILGFYLNTVYFGRGAYGAEAAARTYFGRAASDLDLSQSAYLAGVIRSPEKLQKDRNPAGAVAIRNLVLRDMVDAGYLDEKQAARGRKRDLLTSFSVIADVKKGSPRAAYFVEYIRKQLANEHHLTEKEIFSGGLTVYTTLDLRLQDAAEATFSKILNKESDPEAALVAIDTLGQVRTMIGGRRVDDVERARGFNYAATVGGQSNSGRQAGSAFKPLTLAAFVAQGYSMNSTFQAPAEIQITSKQCRNKDGSPWDVSNFDSESFGPLTATDATVHSVNTIYAQMMDRVGPSKFVEVAKNLGIDVPRGDVGCALTLGTTPVTPMQMARAYSAFALRGQLPDVITIRRITSSDGSVLVERRPRRVQAIDENVADSVNYALAENVKRGTGTAARLKRAVAGKTGTTQNHIDAWFAGYTPDMVTVVWMGYPPKDGQIPQMTNVHGIRVTGGSLPASIWHEFMATAMKGIKASSFVAPNLGGEVIHGELVCGGTPAPSSSPSALTSPSTSPCPSTTPTPTPSPSPSRTPRPSPRPSPSPSPSPSLTPSPSPPKSPG